MVMTINFHLRYSTYVKCPVDATEAGLQNSRTRSVVYVGGKALRSIAPRWHQSWHVEFLPLPLVLALFDKSVEDPDPGARGDVHPHSGEQLNRDRVTFLQFKS